MSKIERLALFGTLSKKIKKFSIEEIENSISKYFLDSINKKSTIINSKYSKEILMILAECNFPTKL